VRNLAMVRAAAEKDPDDAFNWFNLGATAFLVDDFVTARDALERMREMSAGQQRGFMPNGLAVLAETYCDKMGDPVKGEEVALAALEIAPHYANAHFQLGKALVAQKRFEEARQAYLAAIDDGNYAALQFVIDDQVYIWKAHSEIGSSYVMEKDDERALEWFEKGLKNAPKAEPLHINRAKSLERLGRIQEAGEGYAAVYEMYRGAHATAEYVNFLLRNHREREALSIVEESYANLPVDMAVPTLMAAAAVAQRLQTRDDERYLKLANALVPGSAEVLDPLEMLLRERGKEDELPALLAREMEVEPKTALDYLRRARRASAEEQFQRALDLAEAGLALQPNDPPLLYMLATAQANVGRPEIAIETIGRIAEGSEPLLVAAFTLQATLLQAAGRDDEALIALDRVLQIDPKALDALMLRAKIMEVRGADLEYERMLKRVFEIDKQRVAVELASYYLRTNRYDDAAKVADEALQP
jgi:tetratricopeptide (TPR) repeat protein